MLFVFQTLGTPSNTAIHKYVNAKKVPQLFVATGATKWNDPKNFPWTMGWQPTLRSEARFYAKSILTERPDEPFLVRFWETMTQAAPILWPTLQIGIETVIVVLTLLPFAVARASGHLQRTAAARDHRDGRV